MCLQGFKMAIAGFNFKLEVVPAIAADELFTDIQGKDAQVSYDKLTTYLKALKASDAARLTPKEQAKRGVILAANLRTARELWTAALTATEAYDGETNALAAMKENRTLEVQLGMVLKSRNLLAARDLFRAWDDDGSKYIEQEEFEKHLMGLGFVVEDHEFIQLFKLFDENLDGGTSLEEVKIALAKLSGVVADCVANESAKAKSVSAAKRTARAAQDAAQEALDRANSA